jgi:hypothetical protein
MTEEEKMMAQEWMVDGPRVIDVGGENEQVAIVKVALVGGRVDLVCHDDSPTARLEIQDVQGPPLLVRWDGTTLKVSHLDDGGDDLLEKLKSRFQKGMGKMSARVSLSVPASAVVNIATVSAGSLVNGAHNDVKVGTVSGSITLDDIHGVVKASTVSGDVEGHLLHGQLKANTVSGALTVQASTLDAIKLNTVSGDITLDLVNFTADVKSTSVSGDVTVRVPPGGGYAVTARTGSGHVVIDGVAVGASAGGSRSGTRAEGDEALTIVANSVSGNVVVLRNRPTDATGPGADADADAGDDIQDEPFGGPLRSQDSA